MMFDINVNVKQPLSRRIGELAEATGARARSLRHYDQQGLLKPVRNGSGYRVYVPEAARLVERIRWLLAAGFSTRQIREIPPCVTDTMPRTITCPKIRSRFWRELGRLEEQIRALEQARDAAVSIKGISRHIGGRRGLRRCCMPP